MKHNPIILMTLLLGLTLFGCKKQEQEILTPKIIDDKVETTATTATFTWTVDWLGKLISMVEVSENEDMSESQFFGSETETENHNFTVTVTDLKVATKYYYRFWVWNRFYVDHKYKMERKSYNTKTALPKVRTLEVLDVTRTTAVGQGEIVSNGGLEITECGMCWSGSHNPTIGNYHAVSNQNTTSFSTAMSALTPSHTYYVRAYAKNANGIAYGEEVMFVTNDPVVPTVTTANASQIEWRNVVLGGNITDNGDANVTERGVCWSTVHNPNIENFHIASGSGNGSFTCQVSNLTAGTVYYAKAYAKNSAGYGYGNEISFTTASPVAPAVVTQRAVSVNDSGGKCSGKISTDGGTNIIERGICWSVSNPMPTVSDNHVVNTLGGDSYYVWLDGFTSGTMVYFRAYARNSVDVGYGDVLSFTTISNHNWPNGLLPGVFSVSSSKKVYFSQGNLIYVGSAAEPYWMFAQYQWFYLGNNGQGSTSANVFRDLFGWGTSGYHNTSDSYNTRYQPWATDNTKVNSTYNYYGYGPSTSMSNPNIAQSYYDWGVNNAISGAGYAPGLWHTLSNDEWDYLINLRHGYRFAKACVNGVNGVVVFPDNWDVSLYWLNNPNSADAVFSDNFVTAFDWMTILEPAGAVFLPAAGERNTTNMSDVNEMGSYWTSSVYNSSSSSARCFLFHVGIVRMTWDSRYVGKSVRLVHTVQ